MRRAALALALAALFSAPAAGQRERVRVVEDRPVDVFWAPSVITTPSATTLPARNLNVTIFHAFAPVSQGADDLFGLDGTANVRFGLDAGLTDWLTVGVGRTRFDKLYDVRATMTVLRQTRRGTIPLTVGIAANAALATEPDGVDAVGGLSYATSLVVARRFGDALSLQLAPTVAHFNTVFEQTVDGAVETPQNTLVALATGAQFRLTAGSALLAEYVPVLSARSDGTADALAVGLALDTGGHVFQLFLTASPWATAQHTIGRNVDRAADGDLRLGFTVNRLFGL